MNLAGQEPPGGGNQSVRRRISHRKGIQMKKSFFAPLLLAVSLLLLGPLHAAEPIAAFTPGARILFQGDSIGALRRTTGSGTTCTRPIAVTSSWPTSGSA
jgi:hypothetical protein